MVRYFFIGNYIKNISIYSSRVSLITITLLVVGNRQETPMKTSFFNAIYTYQLIDVEFDISTTERGKVESLKSLLDVPGVSFDKLFVVHDKYYLVLYAATSNAVVYIIND